MVALGALVLIAVGVFVWWSDSVGAGRTSAADRGPGDADGAYGSGAGGGVAADGGPNASSGRRRFAVDGGVSRVGVRTEFPSGPGPELHPSGVPTTRGLPRHADDLDRSAGWRLGQAQRRIEILQDRERTYQAATDRLIAEGNEETAARQRVVLERVQGRLRDMRVLESELREEAEADGTMGEVDQGHDEGEPQRTRGATGGQTIIR